MRQEEDEHTRNKMIRKMRPKCNPPLFYLRVQYMQLRFFLLLSLRPALAHATHTPSPFFHAVFIIKLDFFS